MSSYHRNDNRSELQTMGPKELVYQLSKEFKSFDGSTSRYIALIDLHRFKAINDVHGRSAGDFVLHTVGNRIASYLAHDDRLGCLGGDHFIILFGDTLGKGETEERLYQISQEVERSITYHDSLIYIGCSIGAAEWTNKFNTTEILRQLDKAVIHQKMSRANTISWYSKALERANIERVLIEPELREAVQSHSIEPWFQPIIDLETLNLTGFEVLARWSHSSRGRIAPGRFIQTAEHCNLIDELGMNIFKEACYTSRRLDPRLSISFNISPLQFRKTDLVMRINEVIESSKIDPARLTLEITESSVIEDLADAKAKLFALKEEGIQIALDDFGTGYSSLTNLGHLPIDRIKVDRSFITGIGSKPHNQKIVRGIIALAQGLNIEVTIEGIETPSDLAFAQRHGKFLGQGFLFDRALPIDQVELFLKSKWKNGYVGKSLHTFSHRTLQNVSLAR